MNSNSSEKAPQPTLPDAQRVWVDKATLAARYGVAIRTVTSWMAKGLIPYVKPSARLVRFHVGQVDEALNERFGFKGTVRN